MEKIPTAIPIPIPIPVIIIIIIIIQAAAREILGASSPN
jgi:hypothetical protein